MDLKLVVRRDASQLGFTQCGFARLQSPPHGRFVKDWLNRGNAGTMSYLGRGLQKRLDPSLVAPGARGVITLGFPYQLAAPPEIDWCAELRGRVAAYAQGPDYHDVVRGRLQELANKIRLYSARPIRCYVDTGPVLEREWANLGGLGWFGKNTTILHRDHGSWFFLGEIFTDIEFEPEPIEVDHCGTCRRCLELCPTGALKDDYTLDARLCISYLTIEYRGVIPPELRAKLGQWIFGCDVCQEVCPWNEPLIGDLVQRRATMQELFPYLPELLALDADAYRRRYGTRAISRAKRDCFVRNVAIALGNSHNPCAVPSLARALEDDPSSLVRAHVGWALGRIDDGYARRVLHHAWRREADETVRSEIEFSLDGRAAAG